MGEYDTGWWFGGLEHDFYISPYIGDDNHNDPNWLIFFRGVGIPPEWMILTEPLPCFLSSETFEKMAVCRLEHPKINLRVSACDGLPSGYVKIAIENDHRNSGFSHWKWWFSIVVLVYQRVDGLFRSMMYVAKNDDFPQQTGTHDARSASQVLVVGFYSHSSTYNII